MSSSTSIAAATKKSLLLKKTAKTVSDQSPIRISKKRYRAPKETASSSSASFPDYRGVRRRAWGRYVSEIRIPKMKTRIWLGSFDSPEMAARAYDSAAFYLKGGSASLNFPDLAGTLPQPHSSTRRDIQIAAAKAAMENVVVNRNGNRFELDREPMKVASPVSGSKEEEEASWLFLDDELVCFFDDVLPLEKEGEPLGFSTGVETTIHHHHQCYVNLMVEETDR